MNRTNWIIRLAIGAGGAASAWGQVTPQATVPSVSHPTIVAADRINQEAASPLIYVGDNGGYGIRAALTSDAFGRLSTADLRLSDVPLDPQRRVTLEMHSFQVTGPGARIVEGTDNGDLPLAMPPVILLRGEVADTPGSWAFLGVTPGHINGIIHISDDEEFIIAPLPERIAAGETDTHVIYNRLVTDANAAPSNFLCTAVPPPGQPERHPTSIGYADFGPETRGASDRVAWLAIDCDWEFRNLAPFVTSGDAAAYAIELVGVVSFIYERDVQTRMYVNFLRVWSTANDPYSAADTEEQLPEFENYFSNNVTAARDVSHLFSGRDLGGGRAFLDVLCDGYGVSGNMAGTFPRPAPQDYTAGNWDIVVVAHEIGHNFGSPHTHCYNPPIDTCAGTGYDCPHPRVCQQGEIMSYCHTCPGGISNIRLGFVHPAVLQQMREDVDCLRAIIPTVYVDGDWGGAENGNPPTPYNKVLKGFMGVSQGGVIRIRQGTYPEAVRLDRAVRLEVWNIPGGTVRIGG